MIDRNTPILVTGGAGFIGSHLVEALVARRARVTVVDNLSTGCRENLKSVLPEIELCVGDLTELLRAQEVRLAEYAYVFHLAANPYIPPSVENPAFDLRANLYTTFQLLEALRALPEPPHLINVSTAAVYGNPQTLPIHETDSTVPIAPYGVSKLAAERYVAVYSQIYGIRASSVRLFSVYGPRQRKQVVFDVLRMLRANREHLEMLGDGSQARDFAYVEDVVEGMLLVASQAAGQGEVYNVASGRSHTIAELVEAWCELLGVKPQVTYSGHIRPGDAQRWVVDIGNLGGLGFIPRTSLHDGLAAIVNWYDAEH